MELNEERVLNQTLKGLWLDTGGGNWSSPVFKISPYDFLRFAKSDLNLKTKRNTINALSNTKRAIGCQVDTLLYFLGHYKKAKKERWNFPTKISFLKNLNIVGPKILEKIN
ncbi:MAG: hypothetical protein AB1529_04650 [Candidatus Micrarchaeota archaeon]